MSEVKINQRTLSEFSLRKVDLNTRRYIMEVWDEGRYTQQELEDTATELRRVHTWELVIVCSITLVLSFSAGFILGGGI
jgi:hypothetical protein